MPGPPRSAARRASHVHRARSAPSNPHDALFRATFSRIEDAIGILQTILPPALLARLDLRTLTLQPGTFVSRALSSRHSDLLFSVKIDGRSAFLYVLCEHQSTADPLMPFRLLIYMTRIWEAYLDDHPHAHRIPAILPVVIHHSKDGWRAPVSFDELLDLDPETLAVLGPYVPRFRFVLDDLSPETDEALRRRAMTALGRLVYWCLRHSRNPAHILRNLRGWLDLVGEVRRVHGAAALAMIWRYILAISGRRRPEAVLRKLLTAVDPRTQEDIMSIESYLLDKGRREGIAEGRREGIAEGRREGRVAGQRKTLLTQLAARFGPVPAAVKARIQAAGAADLNRWARRVLTAPTLDRVLDARPPRC